jgi:hypothetical protein
MGRKKIEPKNIIKKEKKSSNTTEEDNEEREEKKKLKNDDDDDTMTIIRVPLIEMVDIDGRKIGKYSEEISFLEQIKTPPNEDEKVSALSNQEDDENKVEECKVIGETLLHIAIMYDDLESIKYLIETKDMQVNQRSTGDDFVNGFEQKDLAIEIENSTYKGLAYYGEYPLALAACFANKDIYDYLIAKGGDPNIKGRIVSLFYIILYLIQNYHSDSNGNTLLHVLVINNKIVS